MLPNFVKFKLPKNNGKRRLSPRAAEPKAAQSAKTLESKILVFGVVEKFIENGFVDTYRAAGHGDSLASSSYHGYVGEAYSGLEWGDEQCWRVDWILTRGGAQRLQTVACSIPHDGQPPIYPSDHWPVITDLLMIG